MRRAIFLDRDGIIVQPILGEAPTEVSRLKLIPEIIPVIKKAKKLGNLIFVVSNQPDIALGVIDEETKNKMEKKFVKLLKEHKITMDKIFYCHHDPKGKNFKYSFDCECRKPKPGMLISAKNEFNIDMEKSFIVGDRASDVKAGKTAGVKTILFDPENLQKKYLVEHSIKADFTISNLSEILNLI